MPTPQLFPRFGKGVAEVRRPPSPPGGQYEQTPARTVNPGGPMQPPPSPSGPNPFHWPWPETPPFPITPGWHPSSIWQWEGKPRGDW